MASVYRLLLWLTLSVVLLAVNVSASSESLPSSKDLLVHTTSGLIQGFLDTYTTDVPLKKWLGVPFADDTSGANRWRPPQPVKVTPGKVLNASAYGPACMQGRYVADEADDVFLLISISKS